MWKSIGSINSPDNKSNRSREENNIEPFAQASRLRLNQSQLSGDSSPRFMEHYFLQKRTANTLSQKNLQQNKNSAINSQYQPISLKQVRPQNKNRSKETEIIKTQKVIDLQEQVKSKQNEKQSQVKNQNNQYHITQFHESLNQIKKDQANLNKFVQRQLNNFRKDFLSLENDLRQKLKCIESQKSEKQKKNPNPEILSKLRQEKIKFNERIQQIQNKKTFIQQKFKIKLNQS